MKTQSCKFRYYITARRSTINELVYFVNSPTQGPDVIPYAYSMAYRFETRKQAKETIKRFAEKWKGLHSWKANRENRS